MHTHPPIIIQGRVLDLALGTSTHCSARILRRTSHPSVCWPLGVNHGVKQNDVNRDTFGCDDNASVLVSGGCSGTFHCGNGGTVACSTA